MVMKTLFKSILLISLLLSCQKDNYEEVHLPVLAMNVPEIMQLDSVRLSARILNEGFSELMIAKRGFVLAAEGFQQDWAPKHTDKSWEIGADYIDGPSFSADISNLPIRT
ncbi:MAG: hypothetical protein J5I94_21335, partial [Phaeodactylibacter sp.]|nr:hypothetical protein [Phaeodactylibacter sp.]